MYKVFKFYDDHLCPFTESCGLSRGIGLTFTVAEINNYPSMVSQFGSNPVTIVATTEPTYAVADLNAKVKAGTYNFILTALESTSGGSVYTT